MLDCLECILVKYSSLYVQSLFFGIKCNRDLYKELSDKALDYIYILGYIECTIPESITIEMENFTRKYCKTCL